MALAHRAQPPVRRLSAGLWRRQRADGPGAEPLGAGRGALAVWGIANTALYPVCQIRVMKAASHAQALAGRLNVSAANAGIALGAIIGELAFPAWRAGSVGRVAALIALLAAAAVPGVARLAKRAAGA